MYIYIYICASSFIINVPVGLFLACWKANVDLCVSLANSMGAEQVPFVVFLNPEGVKIFASNDWLEGLF